MITPDSPSPALTFDILGSDEQLKLMSFDLVVAGYTGRDEAAVQHHIDELAAIGIAPPDAVPTFFELDPALVTQASEIRVAGANTSGEVEPVLVRSSGRLYLSVGSDHTDRDIERSSVLDSKAACPKPVARTVVELPRGADLDWDGIEAICSVDGASYQKGSLEALKLSTDVLRMYDSRAGGGQQDIVLFGGTLPLIDGEFVAGTDWTMSLVLADGAEVQLTYTTTVTKD